MDVLHKGKAGEVYNIGTGYRLRNEEIANFILGNFKTKSKIVRIPDRLGHDVRYAVDIEKGRNSFDWEDVDDLENELIKTMKHYWDLFKGKDLDTSWAEEVEGFYK